MEDVCSFDFGTYGSAATGSTYIVVHEGAGTGYCLEPSSTTLVNLDAPMEEGGAPLGNIELFDTQLNTSGKIKGLLGAELSNGEFVVSLYDTSLKVLANLSTTANPNDDVDFKASYHVPSGASAGMLYYLVGTPVSVDYYRLAEGSTTATQIAMGVPLSTPAIIDADNFYYASQGSLEAISHASTAPRTIYSVDGSLQLLAHPSGKIVAAHYASDRNTVETIATESGAITEVLTYPSSPTNSIELWTRTGDRLFLMDDLLDSNGLRVAAQAESVMDDGSERATFPSAYWMGVGRSSTGDVSQVVQLTYSNNDGEVENAQYSLYDANSGSLIGPSGMLSNIATLSGEVYATSRFRPLYNGTKVFGNPLIRQPSTAGSGQYTSSRYIYRLDTAGDSGLQPIVDTTGKYVILFGSGFEDYYSLSAAVPNKVSAIQNLEGRHMSHSRQCLKKSIEQKGWLALAGIDHASATTVTSVLAEDTDCH